MHFIRFHPGMNLMKSALIFILMVAKLNFNSVYCKQRHPMRKIVFTIVCILAGIVIISCNKVKDQSTELSRIAIAGLAIESSTFSPALTHEEAFHARVGDTILASYEFLARDSADYKRAHWVPIL